MAELAVLADGFAFLEGPRWRDGRLWVSDMHSDRVLTVTPEGEVETVIEVPGQPSGLGWLPDGTGLVVSMTDRKLMRFGPEGLELHADLSDVATYHCNDMVVDGLGRAYVGNFGSDFEAGGPPDPAALALVCPDGAVTVAADELSFPNGTVITPDGRTLVVGETFGMRLTAFDIGAEGGLTNRRLFAGLEGSFPDGICLDAEGAVWVASPVTRQVLRVREGGEITHRIPTETQAIACMLGGDDRKTLHVLTTPATNREACRAARGARVETLRVDVPGAGFP